MADVILHHFDASPFAEKIRKLFGVKSIAWRSVIIPMVMPKPELTALTGGYRRTPVLQIGSDIYCDTRLIARVIDRLYPDPPLYSGGRLAAAMSHFWSGSEFFSPGAALSLYENRAFIPKEVAADRRAYFNFLDFDRFEEDAPHFRSQLRAIARLIESDLSDGRRFLCGNAPGATDLDAYFNIWMARGNIPSSERLFRDMPALIAWRDRLAAIGEGSRSELDAAEAIEIAKRSDPASAGRSRADESGAEPGDVVSVAASDYGKDAVFGVLEFVDDDEIIISRRDPRAGDVRVHFPRVGFILARNAAEKKQT